MNIRNLLAVAGAVVFGAATAQDTNQVEVVEEESSFISVEAGIALDSKYLSYGLVDNNNPIITPSACVTFFDWVSVGFDAIFDLTPYGRKKIDGERLYTNRAGKYQEFDPYVEIGHTFTPEDCEWLPTSVEFALSYCYEYHPESMGRAHRDSWGEPSQFITLELGLPDLWLEPAFTYERDIDRDDGTYLNLELGHTFSLVDGESEEDDPVLALRPSVAQGFGNANRVGYYLWKNNEDEDPLHHAGLMDTCVKLELTWNICEFLSLSGYVAYSDFLFDRQIREASRYYEAQGRWTESYNFIGGLALTASF